MILYFSATGNTEFVAKEIAKKLDDTCLNLLNRVKDKDYTPVESDKPYIICAPVYVCEMPRFMAEYLGKLEFKGSKEVYFIFTSGGYCGISGVLAKAIFTKKGMIYKGHAEITMPRNYVANNAYPMLEKEEIEKRIIDAYMQLYEVEKSIKENGELQARKVQLWETLVTVPFNPVWCKLKLTAKDFHVKNSCIGCGKCERLCPLNNIKLVNKKPVWGKDCTHCMACIGNCPTQAIEYGEVTKDKEPYNFGKYKYVIKEKKQEDMVIGKRVMDRKENMNRKRIT